MSSNTDNKKQMMRGVEFIQPLEFGDWDMQKVQRVLADLENKYSNYNDFELVHIDRGGYEPCHCEPGCTEILETL